MVLKLLNLKNFRVVRGCFALVISIRISTGSLLKSFQQVYVPNSGQTRGGFFGTAGHINLYGPSAHIKEGEC
jgi:hypothetical protein